MHVIHCSDDLVSQARLANILPIVKGCLASDMPEAVIVTETNYTRGHTGEKPTLAENVEIDLCCPLTMIPTIYGVKLLDHVLLGSSACCQLHDYYLVADPITLKWYRAPVAFSTDIRLQNSPGMKKVVEELVDKCLVKAHPLYYAPPERNLFRFFFLHNKLLEHEVLRFTPLTFYNVLQPLFDRYNWEEGAIKSIVQQCIPSNYQLAWRTFQH